MPSLVVLKVNETTDDLKRRLGMKKLGEEFDANFKDNSLSPIEVLSETFKATIGPVGNPSAVYKAYYILGGTPANPNMLELEYKGEHSSGRMLKFKFKIQGEKNARRLLLRPVEDAAKNQAAMNFQVKGRRHLMNVAFSETRTSQLAGGSYLEKTVSDIVALNGGAGGIDDAKKYTLATVTFRRCL